MKEKKRYLKNLKSLIIKIAVLSISGYLIFSFAIGVKPMNGVSMFPSIRDGDLIIYSRMENTYIIDDIIIYEDSSGLEKVGRVVAMSGDEVNFTSEGELTIDGKVQNEDIFFPTFETSNTVTCPHTVNENSYFVLSDYRTQGVDSRMTGDIPSENIKGKVISILRIRGF